MKCTPETPPLFAPRVPPIDKEPWTFAWGYWYAYALALLTTCVQGAVGQYWELLKYMAGR